MDVKLLPDGSSLEVTTAEGRRYTFPIMELQAARRRPRVEQNRASDLPVPSPLQMLESARRAAVEFAITNDLI